VVVSSGLTELTNGKKVGGPQNKLKGHTLAMDAWYTPVSFIGPKNDNNFLLFI